MNERMPRIWQAAALLALAATLHGCDEHADVKSAVAQELRDPDSAAFRNIEVAADYVCGEVNGRNGFGGITGFKEFAYRKADKKVFFEPDPIEMKHGCAEALKREIEASTERIRNGLKSFEDRLAREKAKAASSDL